MEVALSLNVPARPFTIANAGLCPAFAYRTAPSGPAALRSRLVLS
jgi:hypothetical protein